jgi:hypothetical protein
MTDSPRLLNRKNPISRLVTGKDGAAPQQLDPFESARPEDEHG